MWAAPAASYCPSRAGELPKQNMTKSQERWDGKLCILIVALTQRFHRRYLAPEKGEPEVELPLLLDAAVGQVEEDHVLAVDVADEVVVEDVVVGVAGELPDAHLAHGALEAIV